MCQMLRRKTAAVCTEAYCGDVAKGATEVYCNKLNAEPGANTILADD
jgi:hypothetical protein